MLQSSSRHASYLLSGVLAVFLAKSLVVELVAPLVYVATYGVFMVSLTVVTLRVVNRKWWLICWGISLIPISADLFSTYLAIPDLLGETNSVIEPLMKSGATTTLGWAVLTGLLITHSLADATIFSLVIFLVPQLFLNTNNHQELLSSVVIVLLLPLLLQGNIYAFFHNLEVWQHDSTGMTWSMQCYISVAKFAIDVLGVEKSLFSGARYTSLVTPALHVVAYIIAVMMLLPVFLRWTLVLKIEKYKR